MPMAIAIVGVDKSEYIRSGGVSRLSRESILRLQKLSREGLGQFVAKRPITVIAGDVGPLWAAAQVIACWASPAGVSKRMIKKPALNAATPEKVRSQVPNILRLIGTVQKKATGALVVVCTEEMKQMLVNNEQDLLQRLPRDVLLRFF